MMNEIDLFPEVSNIIEINEEKKKDFPWKFRPLFFYNSRGTVRIWQICFNGKELVRAYGKCGGKITKTKRKIYQNQSGRSLEDQAILEAKSEYNKKYDLGYRHEVCKVKKPMLAWMYDREKIKSWPVCVQAKIDGIRAISKREGGKIKLFSRENHEFPQDFVEIKDELRDLFEILNDDIEIDGELFYHDFNILSSIVRNSEPHEKRPLVRYLIFDRMDEENVFGVRYNTLLRAFKELYRRREIKFISLLICYVANSHEEVMRFFGLFKELKHEGAIIRNIYGKYRGTRTNDLLKLKDFMDEECTIVDVISGEGSEEGLAIFVVEDKKGKRLVVRPQGSFEQRKKWFINKEDVIGKKYTIRFYEKTKSNSYRFPVGIEFRDYE